MKLSASALLTTFLDNEIFQSAVVIGTNALHQFSHCQERAFGFSWACVGDTPTSRAVAGGNALKAPCGSAGWRLLPGKLDRQPLSFAYLLIKLEASASPLTKGNKKSAVPPSHLDLGNGRMRLQ
jgi:hypothetical protein